MRVVRCTTLRYQVTVLRDGHSLNSHWVKALHTEMTDANWWVMRFISQITD